MRNTPSEEPPVDVCLGTHGDPKGGGGSYERGTPVALRGEARLEEKVALGEGEDGGWLARELYAVARHHVRLGVHLQDVQGWLKIQNTHCPRVLR